MSNNDGNKSLTSTNKWKYVPGKVFNLTPLNLQDIRKQLLDSSNEESDESENEENEEPETEEKNISKILNESFNAGSPEKTGVFEEETDSKLDETLIPKDDIDKPSHKHMHRDTHISTSLESIPEDTIQKSDVSYSVSYSNNETMVYEDKENIRSNGEPLNLSRDRKRNDSFDLDFSALSLNTPVKKMEKNFNYVTPKINIIPSSESKSMIKMRPIFKTPNISKEQYQFSKPLFKTPVRKPMIPAVCSVKKQHGTPYSSVKNPSLYQYNMAVDMQESQKVKPVLYTGEDGFNRIMVNNREYIVMNILGRGGSSEVFYGFNSEEKLHVAIKLVSLSDQTAAEGYINEVKLLESLQTCDRIIKMYDYEIRDEKLIVLLEKGGEDLSAILKQLATKQSHLPIYMLIFYWMEMLYAVKQIHDNGVIHSDLKPSNFLRAEGGLKLIDFGIASQVQEDMTCVYKANQEGSCNYISPEALSLQTTGNVDSPNYGKAKYKLHFKSDVWSLGCILYQLVYRKTPFQHINQIWAKLSAITDPNHKISYPKAEWVSSRLVNTIQRCLQYNTKSRPSVDELIGEYEELLKII